jgi:hypothetical protein
MTDLWNDRRYAARLLIKAPAFTAVAVAGASRRLGGCGNLEI